MPQAGVCTISFQKKPVATALETASRAGADGVELWGQPEHIRYPIDLDRVREVRDLAGDLDLEICALGSYYRAGVSTEYDGEKLTIRNQIEIARELGTRLIRIWAGEKDPGECTADEANAIVEDIRLFGDYASDAGMQVVLERHGGTLTAGWEAPDPLLERINHPAVGLNYQIVGPSGEDGYADMAVRDFTRLLPLSWHAHMHNYPSATAGSRERCFLDNGIIDYSSMSDVIRSAGYEGYFMVEFPADLNEGLSDVDTLRRDIDFIKSL